MQERQQTVSFWRAMYYRLAVEVEQVLGKALGYPYFSTDQKNFPGTTESDGVCTGDNVPESIIAEAARKLTQKPLTFSAIDNFPCNAALEVELEKLATYFDRRSRENKRRANKLELKLNGFHDVNEYLDSVKSSYYFSGKDDTYARAAQKVRELLAPRVQEQTKTLIVEVKKLSGVWERSVNRESSGEYPSLGAAQKAIEASHARNLLRHEYRIVEKQ